MCVSNLIKVVFNRRWFLLLKCESPIRGLASLQVRAAALRQELPVLRNRLRTRTRVAWTARVQFKLLGDGKSIVNFNAQIVNRALKLGMGEQ